MIIALDFGDERIGIAATDEEENFVFPKYVIKKSDFDKNPKIIEGKFSNFNKVNSIIIGLPKNLKGENTIQTEKAISFSETIQLVYPDKKVILYDERFTSRILEKEFRMKGISSRDYREKKDMYEACIILEDYLKRRSNESL
jgi:putative holliday junction resolvase